MDQRARACILFVDDEPANRHGLSWFLENAGYDVVEADTGQAALGLAHERHPDLVVLDVNLPDMTGFEVCKRLRADPATSGIGVVHVSAVYVGSEYRTEGLEGGADAYLVKPFEPRELLATVHSVLRVRRAEEAARAAAQQWRTTFDAISDGICLTDPAGLILRCNRAFCEQLGRPFAHLVGRAFGPAVQSAFQLDAVPAFTATPGHGGRRVAEVRLGQRWFRATTDPIVDDRGQVVGAVRILTDVTERKDLEEQLRQGQKLEAIGRLAGGVAHDFNNLLTAILGNASLLARALPEGEPERELLNTIEQAAGRAADLTRRLLGFSRKTLLWLAPVKLNDPIREVVGILRRTIDPRIQLEVEAAPDLWPVHADASQIGQVLMNLCLNACDAMPQGGRLRLETANVTLGPAAAGAGDEARPGDYVRLRVSDTGHGIPEDVLPRIFDPFFTTKEPGKGTGLGLAMVFGIVKQHQGWVRCHSRLAEGTTFEIYLPRLREAATATTPAPAASPAPGGSETVLVVDDNEMLRNLARILLRQNGFRVLQAEDGQQALEVYRAEHGRIDLVLLDLTMPRLSGAEALAELRKINPRARVLVTSGYAETPPEHLPHAVQGFIGKPYRERDLVAAVRAAIDSPWPEEAAVTAAGSPSPRG